jgi:hypothetical protein
MIIINAKLLKMKKLIYLFVMVAGMTLASVNVNAQDAKGTTDPVKKEATAACSKSTSSAACSKSDKKDGAACCAKKDASTCTGAKTDASKEKEVKSTK